MANLLTRRGFLAGLAALAGAYAVLPVASIFAAPPGERRFVRAAAMGGTLELTVVGLGEDLAEAACAAALTECARLEKLLSRRDGGSALAELNRAGLLRDTPEELLTVLTAAMGWHHRSGGLFDPTLLPLLGRADTGSVAEAWELVGMEQVRLTGRRVELARADMGLTLDGLAKGYVVDRLAEVLTAHGATAYCVNAGGDLRVAGGTPARPWRIVLHDPRDSSDPREVSQDATPLALLPLTEGALATSGLGVKPASERPRSPLRGMPPASLLSASVFVAAGPYPAMAADAQATWAYLVPRSVPADRLTADRLTVDAAGTLTPGGGWEALF